MAGAGAPIVTPLSWPAGYVMAAISKDKDDQPAKVTMQFNIPVMAVIWNRYVSFYVDLNNNKRIPNVMLD
jgi:hypothetical protein